MKKLSLLKEPVPDARTEQLVSNYASAFDDAHFVVRSAVLRYHSAEEVMEFFVALHNQDSPVVRQIWSQLQNNNYYSSLLLDGLWLNEVSAQTPDWLNCIEKVERVAIIGLAHKADSVVAAAYRIKAIIYEEYLQDPQKALHALDEGQRQLGTQHIILDEYRAKIFSLENKETEALELWDRVCPLLESAENPNRVFSYRDAMIAATRLEEWDRVAYYAQQAEKSALKSQYDKPLILGFRADKGFALWMGNKHTEALSIFISIIDELPPSGELKNEVQFWWLYVKLIHTAQWMLQSFEGGAKYFQPPAAWFSDQKIDREMSDESLDSYIYLLYFFAKVEYRCSNTDEVFGRLEKASQDFLVKPFARISVMLLHLDRSLKLLTSDNLIEDYSKFAEYSKNTGDNEHSRSIAGSDFLISYLLAALFSLAVNGTFQKAPISRWMADAEKHDLLSEPLKQFLEFAEYCFSATDAQLLTVLRGNYGYLGIVAAIVLSNNETISPNDRFRADAILLFEGNRFLLWREDRDYLIAQHLKKSWLAVIERQSFDLFGATFSINQIKHACMDESVIGIRKAARIILAIQNAVLTPLHPMLRQQFEKMAQ